MEINSIFWNDIKSKMLSRNENNKLLGTWLDPIEFVRTENKNERLRFILGVPNALHQYFVVENLQDKICTEISDQIRKPFDLEFVITGQKGPLETKAEENRQDGLQQQLLRSQTGFPQNRPSAPVSGLGSGAEPRGESKQESRNSEQRPQVSHDSLNRDLVFSTFVVGKNSEFAHAASFNVARNPGAGDYNPLYIYGPVGMGKTHLLHAAGNHIREHLPHLRVTYISAERFMNECISSIRRHEMDKFRQKYRETSDVLLVDDVQYIARGEAVQEEFFHTINTFIDQKKQVIL
ncbi:MAG TPA: DnaA/Hda family protein, partial [Pseudobdellovibrionaceae bacterium]|nr:DnaA/Hda family protein [Pseudobdellovibrionaceae bacterium]